MTLFACYLEARLPEANLARAYAIIVSQDLFGLYTVDVTFGRIGSSGASRRYTVCDIETAQVKLREVLTRRLSAPRRLGVAYTCISMFDPKKWLIDDSLQFAAA